MMACAIVAHLWRSERWLRETQEKTGGVTPPLQGNMEFRDKTLRP
jgi:hypothetical protein